ncbi:MAG TPA: sodium:solute symporter [Candidatus Angelobacter sp.]|jgi:SSS family transporter|nr:sodium:solute symporter [Candidatus Angelobacter sp.]
MRLHPFDLSIIAVYLIAITLFGLRFRKSQRSLRDYFLADRNIPWWAIALSIVAAETSTLTVIGTPGIAYDGNFGFLQLVFGYLLGRVVICLLFIPQYFRGEMFTAYQLIDRRFGKTLHRVTSGVFLVTRAAAEGVRVWAVSIVVAIALGTNDVLSVAVVMALTLIYTFEGGMAAVIWTDVVQMVIYVAGTIAGFITLTHLVPGGWPAIHTAAEAAAKLRVFDFSFDFHKTYTFWAGVIGGMFLNTASHGTDQLMVQRLLVARNERDSKTALLSSGLVILAQFSLFLLFGAGLWVFYRVFPPATRFSSADRVFPTFIVDHIPRGMAGLLIAAILAAAMSNLSAALNSLSSTTMIDFYLRVKPQTTDQTRLRLSRVATIVWGVILFALALASRHGGKVLEKGLTIASLAYGGLLGVFLLGILTRRATQRGTILGMLTGLALNIYLWSKTPIAWTWYVTFGATTTFVVGYLASLVARDSTTPMEAHASHSTSESARSTT